MDPEPTSLPWDTDHDGRRDLKVAVGLAILVHAALLLVRFAETTITLPPVDAVIRVPLRSIAPQKPEPQPAPPETRPEPPAQPARRIPVPAELAPPEPLPIRELPVVPTELPPAPIPSALVFPEAPPAAPVAPVRFTGDMDKPVRIAGSDPVYTEAARRVRKQGVVILDAVIDASGRVTEIEVLEELGFGLTEAAVRAVEGWRFEPARRDGRPIAVRYNLTVRFALR